MLPIIFLCATLLESAAAPPETPVRFSGGFIQYWSNMTTGPGRLTRQQWAEVLKAMQQAGMDTVIIQHLGWHDPKYSASFIHDDADDATEIILDFADANGMKVYVGLRGESDGYWNEKTFTQKFLQDAAQRNKSLAAKVWDRYAKNRKGEPRKSFAGWYVPLEVWNFTAKQGEDPCGWLNSFFKEVTGTCKELSKDSPNSKTVAISVYFNPAYGAPARDVAGMYTKVLKDTSVDIMIVQDGVGGRGWDGMKDHIGPYLAAFEKACKENKAELWANLECYQTGSQPTTIDRLGQQFQAAAADGRKFVTWDFFHFMNPNTYTDPDMCKGKPPEERIKLYKAYRAKYCPSR